MDEEKVKEFFDKIKPYINNEIQKILNEFYKSMETFIIIENAKPKPITYADNKSSCDHVWVLDNSSTCGNTFRCIKCPAVKTEPVYDPNFFWYDYNYSTHMIGC